MNKDEDDQEDNTTITATRYPCMPSLVALQQMRNRLHLAYVGKKLMKWTAQATGRELRKIAWDLAVTCKHYRADMRDAFILLARARYFYPNLNKMVLEHIGNEANITIDIKTKTISGVKVLHLKILDTGQDTYQHLGLEKGGQAILEAKEAWRHMLKRVVLILEHRTSFELVDIAHKSATKKNNVITKVIIPKLKVTIKFISTELEEKEREDVFRLKRFKQLKDRKKKTDVHICCYCISMLAPEEDVVESTCPVCKKAAKAMGKQSDIRLKVVPCKSAISQGKENKKLLDHLITHIDDVIDLTRHYKLDGIVPQGTEKFIKICNQMKESIEDYANASPLCDVCKKFLEVTSSRIKLASRTASSKSVNIPCGPEKTTKAPPCTENCYNLGPETDKLGHFENKLKEIVKVTRLQNEDGSVTEEKQVITIRTEKRNLRKTGTFASNDDKHTGCGGSTCGKVYGGGTDFGGDGGSDFRSGPRETKSEHAHRSHQMEEPRLRSCISASHPKSNKNATTNYDTSRCITTKSSKVTLPSLQSTDKMKNICGPLPKVSKSSSIDFHICCPYKTASVFGSELDSGTNSQTSIKSCKPTSSASAQTSCKEEPVKKPMVDKSTSSLPICGGENTCTDNSDNKFKTTSTEALWRDTWTSTTDLVMEPSRAPSSKPSRTSSKKPCPLSSCSSRESKKSAGKKRKKNGSCYTIKIIAKPPKVCCMKEKPEEPAKEVVLPGSMFETIKNIFLPPTRSTESFKMEPKEPEIKKISKSCLSKLSSFAPSVKPSITSLSSSSKMCQATMQSQQHEETKSRPSCGSPAKVSSMSCKSMSIGSSSSNACAEEPSTGHTCSKSVLKKQSSCLEKKGYSSHDEEETTSCVMAQTNQSSKCICYSKEEGNTDSCPVKSSEMSTKSASGSCDVKNATTSTKRSARFDIRPLKRHTCEKINFGSCACQSDPHLNRNMGRKPVKRSLSFYECDYYFFRW